MGKLTIDGTLDVSQFWPAGESDADTTKLVVDVTLATHPVHYQAFPNAPAQPTAVYDAAHVKPFGAPQPVIKDGKLTVRLQGIDAPELHVQPGSLSKTKWKGKALGSLKGLKRPNGTSLVTKYRQPQAETGTVRLATFLAQRANGAPLPVRFVSELDHEQGPGAAIDKYGRFVGNILVEPGTPTEVDINLWILEQGLALVALYNSMQRPEIDACVTAYARGANAQGGIARFVTKTITTFDPDLLYRKKGSVIQNEAQARFIHPKLYRRQCTWWAYKAAKKFTSGFDTFLGLSKDDTFFETAEFLNSGPLSAIQIPLKEMVTGGKVVWSADEVVFKEGSSTLYGADGGKLDNW
jgi:endonuclease YncB( thermonuclease family)